ncbi:MAG TPA: sulfatase-like hydrolase/transferase [Vicinamibacterales bacterium]|nr:sulfatase-like hydrolase/transferase [Vicinamibacterales bacterium]
MAGRAHVRANRWLAGLIIALFFVAVAGAAAIGWWYARESPPLQGPILLVSVDGVPATDLSAYGAERPDTPAIDTLASESVVFERAYTHSPQSLPAHASLLTGRLPIEHGVRDDAGFSLPEDMSTLAELLRNRGFATGAAVSSFLLRGRTGLGQGFSFFDDEMSRGASEGAAATDRSGSQTIDIAERWMSTQSGQRFFLFVQVPGEDADTAVMRLSAALKERELYDDATIVLVGDRGDVGSGLTLDDRALRVPLIVKQPDSQGSRRRVSAPVQNVDILPTILDMVRAPVPTGLPGRSLRAVLDDGETVMPASPIYSESLAAYFRFGGEPVYALTANHFRFVRGTGEDLIPLDTGAEAVGEANEAARLRSALDGLIGSSTIAARLPVEPSEEDRYALLGYLGLNGPAASTEIALDANTQRMLVEEHRAAAVLIGQKKYTAGIRALQAIARAHPELVSIHFQIGVLLSRTGRLEEAILEFSKVRELRPDASIAARALADALLKAGKTDPAKEQAAIAVMLAEAEGPPEILAAHEVAARVALATNDKEAAVQHAEAAREADPTMPVQQFVEGRLLYDEGQYEKAAASFKQAAAALADHGRSLADLHLYYGESLARLDRYDEAESQFREELRDFPRSIQAYTSLAMLYRASNRDAAVEDVLNELVASTPTPEGYGVAARLWTILGDPSRAEALRSDARTRFRGDPSLALLGRGGR